MDSFFIVRCGHPHVLPEDRPARIFGEGSASLWAWVWPELIGWKASIVWLFSLVTGNRVRPGDFWGVDSAGDLIIVEAKTRKLGARVDPFADFVDVGKSVLGGTSGQTSASGLQEYWLNQLKKERAFIARHADHLRKGKRLSGTYPGVVPYSNHRSCVRVWRDLYLEHLVPLFTGTEYELRGHEYLRTRERVGNPTPRFVGLVAVVDDASSVLSERGQANGQALYSQVGHGCVSCIAVKATRCKKFVEISARYCPLDAPEQPPATVGRLPAPS